MMKIKRATMFIFLITMLTACAGKYFVRPSENLIQLGKTTEEQVIAEMGNPQETSWSEKNDKRIKIIFYIYINPPLSKAAVFYFTDGILVGHYLDSNFSEDSTDFDMTNATKIVENESTRQNVETVLGKPSGEFIFPMAKYPGGYTLLYQYKNPKVIKKAFIEIDEKGIVRDFGVKFEPRDKK